MPQKPPEVAVKPKVQEKLNLPQKISDTVKSRTSSEGKIPTTVKAKNWLKDKTWITEPEGDSIASNEKIEQLRNWLSACFTSGENLQDLQIQLDWQNNRPSKTTGSRLDPYNPIRSEKYLIYSPDHLNYLQGFCGDCQLSLANGDTFE